MKRKGATEESEQDRVCVWVYDVGLWRTDCGYMLATDPAARGWERCPMCKAQMVVQEGGK